MISGLLNYGRGVPARHITSCALLRNTPLLRRVVEEVGLSRARYLWAEREKYLDTFKLMTMVIRRSL
jgi:hypothetical protein